MVTYRIARLLLALAVRRWPGRLRAQLHREWSAELHVLATQRRHRRMLWYAASLATARPAQDATPAAAILPGLWRVTRLVLVAPVVALASLAAGVVGASLVGAYTQMLPFVPNVEMPLMTLASIGAAVLLARLGRRWTIAGGWTPALLLAVTVPGFALCTLVAAATSGITGKVSLHVPAYAVFFLGLGTVLALVVRLARAGRTRRAWWIGVLGALAVADVATMLPLLRVVLPPEQAVDLVYAPMWLFTALTNSGFGLPHPTGIEIFTIGDVVEIDPFLYIAFTGLALGAVLAARRAPVPADEPPVPAGEPPVPAGEPSVSRYRPQPPRPG
jgi:hypothetical protein